MKKTCYVFCHGFGLDVSFWRFLAPYFKTEETFYCDLGYFGEPSFPHQVMPEKFDYVGIGHSLGLMKLLTLSVPWKSLLGLHGFINFLGYESTLRAKRMREWEGLHRQMKRAPIATLQYFYERVGVEASPCWASLNTNRLLEDLEYLTTPATPKSSIVLFGSQDDVIVPPVLLEDNLNVYPNVRLEYVEHVKHNLGYARPDIVRKWSDYFDGSFST